MEDNVHQMELKRMYDYGRWFMISRDLLRIMKTDEALLLSFLCNVGTMEGGEWFPCSAKRVRTGLQVSEKWEKRVMRSLSEKGYIARKVEGMPRERTVKVNYRVIEDACKEAIVWVDEGE